MISLYSKLRESLLDDEDDIIDKGHAAAVSNVVKEIDGMFAMLVTNTYNRTLRGSKFTAVRKLTGRENSYIEGDTLYAKSDMLVGLSGFIVKALREIFNEYSIKNVETFDAIANMLFKDMRTVNTQNAIFKNFAATRFIFNNVDNIEDINMNIKKAENGDIPLNFLTPIVLNCYGSIIKLNNININNQQNNSSQVFTMNSAAFPVFEKCNIKGIHRLAIYDPFIFDHTDVIAKFDNILDFTHTVNYMDSTGKEHAPRKTNWKKIIAAVNNPKKYIFKSSDNDKILKFKPNFKLKDFINIDCFDNLTEIILRDNKVSISFWKIDSSPADINEYNSHYNIILPNDNWICHVGKEKI